MLVPDLVLDLGQHRACLTLGFSTTASTTMSTRRSRRSPASDECAMSASAISSGVMRPFSTCFDSSLPASPCRAASACSRISFMMIGSALGRDLIGDAATHDAGAEYGRLLHRPWRSSSSRPCAFLVSSDRRGTDRSTLGLRRHRQLGEVPASHFHGCIATASWRRLAMVLIGLAPAPDSSARPGRRPRPLRGLECHRLFDRIQLDRRGFSSFAVAWPSRAGPPDIGA